MPPAGKTRTRAVAGAWPAPRLIAQGPPAQWRFAGLTVVIRADRAELRYAREPVGSSLPTPEAITLAVQRARDRLAARSRPPGELLPALARIYAALLEARGARSGERVPLVAVRDQLAGTRAQFAWDLARLRRERQLVVDDHRVDLGIATGHATARRSQVVWIEDEGGGGSYFASFRLIPQELVHDQGHPPASAAIRPRSRRAQPARPGRRGP
jgi:hypothetical protein